ncbi:MULTISPECIES: ABC transporter substrate-binding protein [Brevibacillus]|nr:glycine betaine ABC transporter substrate-binding protein [Brevibacillus borstelensis]MCM3468749.1 glycine/betaine ABC transporter substrate-binding protein [Brevibacillus borstelensis]MCM3590043.1 glycine/betaine ABC transporter substrate-binding protein [Brevibacillus borstelensis]MCM3621740.1 glycine/betaine ABC transporter substrate-binding protein [Brevibacillus borstelensis]MED1743383.1 glycine betaine ABC transporter substrate-binding protein [Brevibacillus borstelensis]MED1853083.1 
MRAGWLRKVGMGVLALSMMAVTGCSVLTGTKASDQVTVVGKNFTEQDILTNLVGIMLEKNTDLKVETKPFLGGTDVAFNAVKGGSADLYVEYTGTGLVNIMGQEAMKDPQEVYDKVKADFAEKYKMEWLEPIGFNNTYALAVTKETADKYKLKTISDLIPHAQQLTFGTEQEFLERSDGLKGLEKSYGLKFKGTKSMDAGLKYKAISEGNVDIIDAFSTDGQLVKHDLVILEDDKHFFPPYFAAPLVRQETLQKHPQIKEVLSKLAGKIDDKQMAVLNAQVDVDKKKSRDVAEAWLKEQGLIP